MPDSALIVDGHTHLYEPSTVTAALDAADRNFASALRRHGATGGYGLLLLADPAGVSGFEWLCTLETDKKSSGWHQVSRPDESVVHLARSGALPLAVISGRQIITGENLEVLAFPRPASRHEGSPLPDLIDELTANGHLAILPWGVGKWTGRRARVIERVLGSQRRAGLAVGDNGGRPSVWARVNLLRRAGSAGYADIRGSDPLPVAGEPARIGSYGVMLEKQIDHTWDTPSLLGLLTDAPFTHYGKRFGLLQFARCQWGLRYS